MVELSNGCICCTINEDLVDAVYKVLEREDKVDYMVIETTGVADPLPIILTFLGTELRDMTRLDSIVTMVDSGTFTPELFDSEAAFKQITYAGTTILNKVDLASTEQVLNLESYIRSVKKGARLLHSKHGQVPINLVLDVEYNNPNDYADLVKEEISQSDRDSHKQHEHHAHESHDAHAHHHEHKHEHEHNNIVLNKTDLVSEQRANKTEDFLRSVKEGARILRSERGEVPLSLLLDTNLSDPGFFDKAMENIEVDSQHLNHDGFMSLSFQSNRPIALKKFQQFLDYQLLENVFRAKGILWFNDSPLRHIFQLSGKRFTIDDSEWVTPPQNRMVLIGRKLDKLFLLQRLNDCLLQ